MSDFIKVETPTINKRYHVSWAKGGCVWILVEIIKDKCILVTPRTKKRITVLLDDLRHTRKDQSLIK